MPIITGKVYIDTNSNGALDPNDQPAQNINLDIWTAGLPEASDVLKLSKDVFCFPESQMPCVRQSNKLEPSGAVRLHGGRIFFGSRVQCQAQTVSCLAPRLGDVAPELGLLIRGVECLARCAGRASFYASRIARLLISSARLAKRVPGTFLANPDAETSNA